MAPNLRPSELILENGIRFKGFSPSWQKEAFCGEVVFTTGMTGYPESLSDPSYTGQILTFTYPLIGNYGIPREDRWESKRIHASGVVVNHACENWSHYEGIDSLFGWLEKQKTPIITGVDTRALTKVLRSSGTMLGAIVCDGNPDPVFIDPNDEHLVAKASSQEKKSYNKNEKIVYAIDCGMKENIIRSLQELPITVHRVPYHYDFTDQPFDGVFISNGPGNPENCPETISIIQKAMQKNKPMFGICLGTQLMALASGGSTYKLPFGHRGHNQPCIDVKSNQCYITSQNHGYAVCEKSLPKSWEVTFQNLNDGSVEGIAHREKPFFAVQFHPEATPGPTDTLWLFEKFYSLL